MSDPITIGPSPAPVNLAIYRGAALDFSFQLCDADGVAIDCTGCTLHAAIQATEDGDDEIDLDPDFTTASTGTGAIELTGNQTGNLTVGRYLWDMKLEDSQGKILGPIMRGGVTVLGRRTNANG